MRKVLTAEKNIFHVSGSVIPAVNHLHMQKTEENEYANASYDDNGRALFV
jgi:hypothetical protein